MNGTASKTVEITHAAVSSWKEKKDFLHSKMSVLINENSMVLDAGCGELDSWGFHHMVECLIGCDVDRNSIRDNKEITFGVVADLESHVFHPSKFDLVLSCNVVEHLQYPDRFIANAAEWLKPGGYIFIAAPNRNSPFGLLACLLPLRIKRALMRLFGKELKNEVHYYRLNTSSVLVSTLSSKGFRDIHITLINRLFKYPHIFGKMDFFCYQLCKSKFFSRFSNALLCIATKTTH